MKNSEEVKTDWHNFQNLITRHPTTFPPSLITFDKFKRAYALVLSRIFTQGDDSFFAPVLDLFNHRCEQRIDSSVVRVAKEEAMAGMPIISVDCQADASSSDEDDTPCNKAFSKLVKQEKTKLQKLHNKKTMQHLKQTEKWDEDFCANED